MFKVTYLEDSFIKEKEITFEEAINDIESYFVTMDSIIKDVNIKTQIPSNKGVGIILNNHIRIQESLYECFKEYNNNIILEFKEFTQSIAINENANITIDFIHDRIFINDYNITIYFNPEN